MSASRSARMPPRARKDSNRMNRHQPWPSARYLVVAAVAMGCLTVALAAATHQARRDVSGHPEPARALQPFSESPSGRDADGTKSRLRAVPQAPLRVHAASPVRSGERVAFRRRSLPLAFEPNVGQTDSRV